ncbi:hypothetical protein BHE74_00018348 [Ensete ventricosum]|nr:hypothetical protein BHE74_00018348 [Ensete ventricosum]
MAVEGVVGLGMAGRGVTLVLQGSAEINKDQHSSADPTQESVIGELKQYGGSEFDYSTIMTKSSWEPRGMLQPKQKIKDSAKDEEMQHLQRLQ